VEVREIHSSYVVEDGMSEQLTVMPAAPMSGAQARRILERKLRALTPPERTQYPAFPSAVLPPGWKPRVLTQEEREQAEFERAKELGYWSEDDDG
jgi:hypothetical protein